MQQLRPFRPISPGEILQEELEARGWTQADLAEILGRPVQAINEIIAGKKGITPSTAIELARAFGTSPEFWLNLESAYRLDLLSKNGKSGDEISRKSRLYSLVPLKELIRRGWIRNTRDTDALEREVCRFLGINSLDERPRLALAARRAGPTQAFSSTQLAWICRIRQLAQNESAAAFNHERLSRRVAELPRLSVENDFARLRRGLASLGIRLVVVEPLPSTRIDGVALWTSADTPVLGLSLRYDRIDYFWFTLMHELAHILQGRKGYPTLDVELVGPSAAEASAKPAWEQAADAKAAEWLIPGSALQAFIERTRPYYSRSALVTFAGNLGIHPGILVGRLQRLGEIDYRHSRGMLVKVRDKLLASFQPERSRLSG